MHSHGDISKRILIFICGVLICLTGGYLFLKPIEGNFAQTPVSPTVDLPKTEIIIPFILILLGVLVIISVLPQEKD